jgi:hypothetical protein
MKPVGEPYVEQIKTKEGKILKKNMLSMSAPRVGVSSSLHLSSSQVSQIHLLTSAVVMVQRRGCPASQETRGAIDSHFKAASASEYDKAMYGYMHLIIMKSLPISYMEDSELCSFPSIYNSCISRKNIQGGSACSRLSSLLRKASLRRLSQHNVDQLCTMVGHAMGPTSLVSFLHIADP